MPKNVQMPDGRVVEFPDSMSDAEVSNAIRTSSRPQITQPKPTLNKVVSPSEIKEGFLHTIPNMIMHPLQTAESIGQPIVASGMAPEGYPSVGPAPERMTRMNEAAQRTAQEGQRQSAEAVKENPGYALGGLGSQVALGAALHGIGKIASAIGEPIRAAAIGDPDVAALRGLKVPAGSPKSLRTISAVQGSRPFLTGAQSLEDLQARIPGAKNEIWGPYKETVDAISGKRVQGPSGPTTVGQLESDRVQLSALNRALKQRNPEAIQLAQQKGLTQAQLLQQEKATQAALDPHLEEAGIKPQAIRQAFGQVAQIGERVSGKSTLAEPKQAFGLSKLKDVSLTKPLSNIPLAGDIGKDILAGRYLSAKPTDVALREGFRTGGPKPNFGTFKPGPPPLQLPAETIGNAEFGPSPSRTLGTGIERSQRNIAQPEILSPNPKANAIRLPAQNPPAAVAPPAPSTEVMHVYPAGSINRTQPIESQVYPPGSAFRAKIPAFDIDEYLRSQQ